jgi:UDP-N-acetylmuramoyl-L-alanyl-D-glutamate--2,6-diaminopimelate ligase
MLKKYIKNLKHYLIAVAAYWYYGRPARKLVIIGVTGTKGKSTTCRFIASALSAGGHKVGILSTVEFQIGDKRWLNDKKMTMLGLGQIQKMLRDMVRAGCRYAVIETSSEGILQYRHLGLLYDIAVFTNLGTEHNERHGGFANLRADKGKMFAQLSKYKHKIFDNKKVEKIIVANLDDDSASFYLNYTADRKIGVAIKNRNSNLSENYFADIISADGHGVNFKVEGYDYHINLVGEFNTYNALLAIAVAASQKISREKIAAGLNSVKMLEGRMEFIEAGQKFKVIVDYAHEPLSLTELFLALRKLVTGKVIAVIGSDGGGRDKTKRAQMGEIAGKFCDYIVISDVNCYDENPEEIAQMLATGARLAGKKDDQDLFIVVDRWRGIKKAIDLATDNDVVVITAKGTEPYIGVANGEKIPWDDRVVAREILQK